jgi:hypothetical protein
MAGEGGAGRGPIAGLGRGEAGAVGGGVHMRGGGGSRRRRGVRVSTEGGWSEEGQESDGEEMGPGIPTGRVEWR